MITINLEKKLEKALLDFESKYVQRSRFIMDNYLAAMLADGTQVAEAAATLATAWADLAQEKEAAETIIIDTILGGA